MQFLLTLIPRQVENNLIHQRAIDAYVNATAMCKAVGKQFNDYTRIGPTKEFLAELSSETGIPVSDLIQVVKGGDVSLQGSWVHPDVAINLGQWCSPKFAVAVAKWVREWITGKLKPATLPYHIERYMANRSEIPITHFSMLNEMIFALIAPLESSGYVLPDTMVPDISEGKMFCKWLREKRISTQIHYPPTDMLTPMGGLSPQNFIRTRSLPTSENTFTKSGCQKSQNGISLNGIPKP